MASTKMNCRVCGKEYEPCRTANRRPNVFHWQEVACSPECGAIYLQRVIESRKPARASADEPVEYARKSKRRKEAAFVEAVTAADEPSTVTIEVGPSGPHESDFDISAEVE